MVALWGARDAGEIRGLARFGHINPDTILRALESRWRGDPAHQQEAKIVTLDGRGIDVLMTATRPGLTNEPGMSVMGIIDITERVRAQEMLQRVQADFAHAARVSMLGELTASIAHEINQPLTAIAINGEVILRLLDRSEPDTAEAREMTKSVVDDARRAADIIGRVRTMARRQAPEQNLLSIDEVISEALLFLRHEIQSHGLTVTHHTNATAPKVLGDRTQLQQVFVNLTANAIQATAQMETTRRTIVIRTTLSDPHTLCCSLEDSGPGIKPEHLDQLFDSFFSTKDAGMGLGLAISRSLIEAHGGCIRADNESTFGGARFTSHCRRKCSSWRQPGRFRRHSCAEANSGVIGLKMGDASIRRERPCRLTGREAKRPAQGRPLRVENQCNEDTAPACQSHGPPA
jgi:signal transduction histidine kinase